MKKCVAIGIILLFVGTSITQTTAQNAEKQSSSRGNWLYVGGSGPGNYTRIQDAVDNATDGDTVFVYDDSSPYVENIVVDVSISLIGAEKNTTIIDGAHICNSINLTADNVTIMGFTIKNGNDSGIYLTSNHNKIYNNIISENFFSIRTHYENLSTAIPPAIGHNTIINNRIINNGGGIFGVSGWNNTIRGNIISQSEFGLTIGAAVNNNISLNSISENFIGVTILASYNTTVYHNNISENELGILTYQTSSDNILQNNFIANNHSAMSHQSFFEKIRHFKFKVHLPVHRNVWNGNYWNKPRSLPYMIPGVIMKAFFKIDFGLQIDWHPAQEPYDLAEMS